MREISLHILDIATNSLRAKASRIRISVDIDEAADALTFEVRDDGEGMPPLAARLASGHLDPRPGHGGGSGLGLLASACERAGGWLDVWTVKGEGTGVRARFGLHCPDRAPLGALADTVANLSAANPGVQIVLNLSAGPRSFDFDSREAKAALGGAPVSSPVAFPWMRRLLEDGVTATFPLEGVPGHPGHTLATRQTTQ